MRQGSGGEGEPDDDGVASQARGDESEGGEEADGQGDRPPQSGEPHRLTADAVDVQLVAGQKDQVAQPEIRQPGDDAVQVGDIEDEGADQDAEADLEDDLGNGQRTGDLGEDGRDHSDEGDEDQRLDGDQRHGRPSRSTIASP